MAQARNTSTERLCPFCRGAGALTVRHPSGNPALECDVDCSKCVGGWIRWAPIDPLLLLAHVRRRPIYRSHLYKTTRARAYLPVPLPKCRQSLVLDAERDARVALQNHAFVMGSFERLLAKAA